MIQKDEMTGRGSSVVFDMYFVFFFAVLAC